MRRSMIVPVLAACFGLLAGCGGGSGSSGNGGGGGGNGGSPTTVTFKVTGATPTAVATRVGTTGSFSATAVSATSVTLSIPSGTSSFAVAWACPAATGSIGPLQFSSVLETVLEATTSDGTTFQMNCPQATSASTAILTGSVDATAISGANYVGVAGGGGNLGNQYYLSGASASFSKAMPAGSDRVAVGAYAETAGNPLGLGTSYTLLAVRNFDGVTVPGGLNGGNTVALGAADAVTTQPITYKNPPSGYLAPKTSASYEWAGGGGITLSTGATTQYPAPPAGAAESGDVYVFTSTCQSSTSVPLQLIEVANWTGTAGPLTVTFPAVWPYAGPTPAALPSFSVAYSGFSGSGNIYYGGNMSWQSTSAGYARNVVATASYMSGSTTLAVPDLSGVQGFAAPPVSGASVFWTALIGQTSFPALQSNPTSGTAAIVSSSGTYSVP